MAQYIYSLENQDYFYESIIRKGLIDKPEFDREYLPEALRNPIKGIMDIVKSNAPVCLDPESGHITIDQIRLYAYQSNYKKKETEAREGLVKNFVDTAIEPFKSYASERIVDLDWNDDKAFREAMEDILVEYEARAAYDPKTFPTYGQLFRHTYSMEITRRGIVKGIENEGRRDYFTDSSYQDKHMRKVHKRYDEIKEAGEHSETLSMKQMGVYEKFDEAFFNAFNSTMDDNIDR